MMMATINIHPSVLNRLVAARHLIDTSGQELSALSDPLAVAQKILIAHDAAELAILALISQLGLTAKERDFMDQVKAVLREAFDNEPAEIGTNSRLFEHLNRLRVEFKHHGLLPDSRSSYHRYADILRAVDILCERLLGRKLLSIDHTAAIHLGEVSSRFVDARLLIDNGQYMSALEAIALGLSTAFWYLDVSAAVGEPSSETALLLSGRGIDPASFLTMQKLLPNAQWPRNETEWILRKTGHEGNWTKENADFCLQTAISTVVRLQSAPLLPRPKDFYVQFEDVVEIVTDHPVVHLMHGHYMGGPEQTDVFDGLSKGDQIIGQAVGQFEMSRDYVHESGIDLDYAIYIAIKNPRHPSLKQPAIEDFTYQVLWFERKDVKISYQISEQYLAIQKSYLNPGE